jgi:molybdate transport system substrate-binding protein
LRLKILVGAILLIASMAAGDELRAAAAADLNYAFRDIAARFERETGHKVNLIVGSSGNFYSQIQNGAPFDLFFSADIQYPQKLEAAGLAEKGSLYRYAIGKIVLWVSNTSKLDVKKGLVVLLEPSSTELPSQTHCMLPTGSSCRRAKEREVVRQD